MVVADGDGVIVVPREATERVAEIAWDIAMPSPYSIYGVGVHRKTEMPLF